MRSFFVFFETIFPSSLIYIFSVQWWQDLVHFPIFRPEIQLIRSSLRIFSTIPFSPSDIFPKNISVFVVTNIDFITKIFQSGFFNAFFLTFPRSLSFLVTIRRYWLQGFKVGLRSTVGYRIGETFLLRRVTNGFRPLWWTVGSSFPLSVGFFITNLILWESFSYHNLLYWQPSFFNWQRTISYIWKNKLRTVEGIIRYFFQNRYLFFVIFIHFSYAWTELGIFFRVFINQTCDIQDLSSDFSHFSYSSITFFSYRSGFFLGGLFFDLFFRIIVLIRLERFFLNFRFPLIEWKKKIHRLTRYLMISFSFRRIPYYSADYLSFSSLGFFGRDIELRRRVIHGSFNYSITPRSPLPILIEGRNVIVEDCYGRPSPDILQAWLLNCLTLEVSHDSVDETYRTQYINQRVDSVYLGIFERKIFEWLSLRNPKSLMMSDQIVNDQNKKAAVLVREPIRKSIGINVTPRNNSLTSNLLHMSPEWFSDRFLRWFRLIRNVKSGEDKSFGLPSGYFRKVPESLFALSTNNSQQSYLASIGMLEPQRVIRYSNSIEFTRKRNARRSPLHRAPILRYIDLFLKTRSEIKGIFRDVSTRQQQRDLYCARLILHNYVSFSRCYLEIEQIFRQISNFSGKLVQRINWQNKFYYYLFGGGRSRSSSVYSQQYIGNLQLIRRLFSVSWFFNENMLSFHFQFKGIQFLRRKIALDQGTFDKGKTIFEHEELGKIFPVDRRFNLNSEDSLDLGTKRENDWFLFFKRRSSLNFCVETIPLYVGWDNHRHSIILCNRFLPLDWSIRTKLFNKVMFSFYLVIKSFKSHYTERIRREFRVWPKNFQTRRMRLRNVRYNTRIFLKRRILIGNINSLLSEDRSMWRGKTYNSDASIFAFWFNPRSDIQRKDVSGSRNPVRGSQRFPFSLERGIHSMTYILGDLQPSIRGGLIWSGTNFFALVQKNYH